MEIVEKVYMYTCFQIKIIDYHTNLSPLGFHLGNLKVIDSLLLTLIAFDLKLISNLEKISTKKYFNLILILCNVSINQTYSIFPKHENLAVTLCSKS